jgi:hypothetical protein
LNSLTKIGLVIAGYVAAFLAASAVVTVYIAATPGVDRQGAAGMTAFGDGLLFLAVLGVAALPATAAALYFLRPWRPFWIGLSMLAVVCAATGTAAAIVYLLGTQAGASGALHEWSGYAVLRILIAPLFALAFFVAGLVAPKGRFRLLLLSSTAVETVVFSCIVLTWLHHTVAP